MQTQTPDRFAFGENTFDGEACPVLASGRDVSGDELHIAEMYDDFAREITGQHDGVTTAETAREAWEKVVETLESSAARQSDRRASKARAVASVVFDDFDR